jgi:hypothetical protein
MNSKGNQAEIGKKALEISIACFQVARNSKEESIQKTLQKYAVLLLETASANPEFKKIAELSAVVKNILALGAITKNINPAHEEIIKKELDVLGEMIRSQEEEGEWSTPGGSTENEIKTVDDSQLASANQELEVAVVVEEPVVVTEDVVSIRPETEVVQSVPDTAINRQTVIVEKIKDMGNCRLKDLMEFMPDVSERTIRYDLQKLAEMGVIERVGGGGPFSFYRIKNISAMSFLQKN